MELRKLGSFVGITCLLTLALSVFPATPVGACSCAGPVSPGDYLRNAEVAFLGDVIAARIADPESVIQGEARLAGPEMIYTLDVQDVYKGSVTERQEVSSSLDGASCGAGLQVNRRYVVYAREGDPTYGQRTSLLYTGLCDGTYEPDGVNSFPLASGTDPAPEDRPAESVPPGDVKRAPASGPSLSAFAGLMLLSAGIAAAAVGLAGRT